MTATTTQTNFEFNVANQSFQSIIKPAVEVATKGVVKDVPSAYMLSLEAYKDKLILKAFGGKLGGIFEISDINYQCEEEGAATINAVDLNSVLNSFPPDEELLFKHTGKELVISLNNDTEEVQALPVSVDDIVVPEISKKFDKQVSIDRKAFLHGYKKSFWAIGFEDHKEQYFYWQMLLKKDSARFVCGTGGRFGIFDMSGNGFISKCDGKTEFLFHKDQLPVVASALDTIEKPASGPDDIVVSQASRDGSIPEQIVIETESAKLILVGFDTNIKYPLMDKFLDPVKPFVIRTRVKDWEYPTKGLMAAWTVAAKKEHDSHESAFEPRLSDNIIKLETLTGLRTKRKVKIEDIEEKGESDSVPFYFTTSYLAEVYKNNDNEDSLEVKFFDDPLKPVIVESPEKDNESLGVIEKMTLLLAPLKKSN